MKEFAAHLTESVSDETQKEDSLTKDMHDFKNKLYGGYLLGEIREAAIEVIMFCQRRRFSCLQKGEGVKAIYKLSPILEDVCVKIWRTAK